MLKINLSPRESDRISAKLNLNAAGIDIGASEHWVCVPAETTEKNVRCFGCFTPDLEVMADWLISCGVETVAMESTSVDWIPVFQMLEARGLEVFLVNAHHVKTVPGRKSDVLDCQWLQELHTYGLFGLWTNSKMIREASFANFCSIMNLIMSPIKQQSVK